MSEAEDLVVTIEVDTRAFDEAMRGAMNAVRRFQAAVVPYVWKVRLARQRDRSRIVTRRKQRRAW